MRNMKKGTRWIALLICFVLILGLPGVGLAGVVGTDSEGKPIYAQELDYIYLPNDSDRYLLIGETKDLIIKIVGDDNNSFSKSVTAYVSDENGDISHYTVNGTGGNYTVNDLIFNELGDYTLYVEDSYDNTDSLTLSVIKPKISITGELKANTKSQIKVKLTDPDGGALSKRQITVDGTDVGVNSSNYTTIYDGTFTFTMTPSNTGTVRFMVGPHEIGTMEVNPAYTQGTRIGGNTADNVARSIEIAREGWTKAGTVILTRDDLLGDSMVAVPLSKKFDAPILMNPSQALDERIREELRRLEAKTVLIIGGTVAVSPEVQTSLTDMGIYVKRFEGLQIYDTAALVAEWVGTTGGVYLAYNYGEPDALAVSSFAAQQGFPILLTDSNSLPQSTADMLAKLNPNQITIVGGTAVISPSLEAELKTRYDVKRWGGYDRYDTEYLILLNLFNKQSPLYFASGLVAPYDLNGKPYGDALAAAALAAKKNGFVITIPPDRLPNSIKLFMLYNKGYISKATVIGNYNAIRTGLENEIKFLLAH